MVPDCRFRGIAARAANQTGLSGQDTYFFSLTTGVGDKGARTAVACAYHTNDLACFINAVHPAISHSPSQNPAPHRLSRPHRKSASEHRNHFRGCPFP